MGDMIRCNKCKTHHYRNDPCPDYIPADPPKLRKHYLREKECIPAGWIGKVVVLWEEDDAPVPDKEKTATAFKRISGCIEKPLHTIDNGDEFISFYRGGWVKSINCEGGWVGVLVRYA